MNPNYSHLLSQRSLRSLETYYASSNANPAAGSGGNAGASGSGSVPINCGTGSGLSCQRYPSFSNLCGTKCIGSSTNCEGGTTPKSGVATQDAYCHNTSCTYNSTKKICEPNTK